MSEETKEAVANPLDQKLVRRVALAMFRAEREKGTSWANEHKAQWAEKKADYIKQARKLCRALERQGVSLVLQDDDKAED